VAFDTNLYLDKLFHLRINLRALRGQSLRDLIDLSLAERVAGAGHRTDIKSLIRRATGVSDEGLAAIIERTFYLPELANPRFLTRVLNHVALFLISDPSRLKSLPKETNSTSAEVVEALVRLCAVAERWPGFRSLLQASDPAF
jgi:hypothetical protein